MTKMVFGSAIWILTIGATLCILAHGQPDNTCRGTASCKNVVRWDGDKVELVVNVEEGDMHTDENGFCTYGYTAKGSHILNGWTAFPYNETCRALCDGSHLEFECECASQEIAMAGNKNSAGFTKLCGWGCISAALFFMLMICCIVYDPVQYMRRTDDVGNNDVDLKLGADELKRRGYTAHKLKDAGYTAGELKDANYSVGELKGAGYSIGQLQDAGFGVWELKDAGFSAWQLTQAYAGYAPIDADTSAGRGHNARNLSRPNKSNVPKMPWPMKCIGGTVLGLCMLFGAILVAVGSSYDPSSDYYSGCPDKSSASSK
eukprot:gnl/MRDRNA2_/MRDRNA2_79157_c0_seq1.p1 gnl/MRDRNA2_/MRDRNA2_79157_c0~~gnl/MRDRNA2_/MRDRNA2_79157_c0_seq1.p1  ORF type:complete len:317 (+),score=59.88 gnl/MRDRNA2_/MRDRNA2_79157_c0_seq1:92-1042(+)